MKSNKTKQQLKTLCQGVALVTAWGVGQAQGATVAPGDDYQFSGTISPTSEDLGNLYLLYGSGHSGILSDFGTISLGSVTAGSSLPFSETRFVLSDDSQGLIIIGTYGNTTGGYQDGVNGVTVSMESYWGDGTPPNYEGKNWSYFFSTPEATVFGYLTSGDDDGLESFFGDEIFSNYDQEFYDNNDPMSEDRILLNFSDASDGGSTTINTQVVPEGSSSMLALLGLAAVVFPRRRQS